MQSKIPFDKFFKNISSKPYQISKDKYLEEGQYPIIDQGQKYIIGYSNDNSKIYKIKKPVIIFGDHTRIIKYIDFDFIIGADGTKILFTDDTIFIKYAYYQLLHTKIESLGYSRHYKLLKEKEFIKPPLEQQKQIAKTLDMANELINLRKESITKLDALAKSIFIDMFGDPVSNPKKWEFKYLEEIVTKECSLSYGIVQPGDDFENGVPIVRPVDLNNMNFLNLKRTKPEISNSYKKTLLNGNEILLSVRGTTGSLGLATSNLKNANVTRGLVPISLETNEKKLFVYGVLSSVALQQVIQEKTYGATLKQINLSEVRKLKIINPPIDLQNKFAKIIEKIEEQKELYTQELEKLQENFDALLQKSFQ